MGVLLCHPHNMLLIRVCLLIRGVFVDKGYVLLIRGVFLIHCSNVCTPSHTSCRL